MWAVTSFLLDVKDAIFYNMKNNNIQKKYKTTKSQKFHLKLLYVPQLQAVNDIITYHPDCWYRVFQRCQMVQFKAQ